MSTKKLAVGILAHVDAGKTTLSEAMLFCGGALRKLGRVDHRDSFLDTGEAERQRGITIFSKQAVLELGETRITLLDTPGHVDFAAETERTLPILDYAILVVSGADGVQGHTETLWRLLARYQIPTFVFVNKMDQPGADRAALLADLQNRLSAGCVDFSAEPGGAAESANPGKSSGKNDSTPAGEPRQEPLSERLAMLDENIMETCLSGGIVTEQAVAHAVARRRVFPVYFGSALRLTGVEAFLDGLSRYTQMPVYPAEFGARVYKIFRDETGARLTAIKVTGGTLRVKSVISGGESGTESAWQQKADAIRIYSGAKFKAVDEAPAGTVCAVLGLTETLPGQGLGAEIAAEAPVLEPVLSYRVFCQTCDDHTLLGQLRQLQEEDPQLRVSWDERSAEIHLQLMGEVQLEILQSEMLRRFGVAVEFGEGKIRYKETIQEPTEGVGHFEPLRHYAEVHLLLEPGRPGSGLHFAADCSEEILARNWQRLVLTHLAEKTHLGVLTGAPITDLSITLVSGRAHLKHTEGGDFREATYRAVRQGLRRAKSTLLEPVYAYRLELPAENVGRAMADLQRRSATVSAPETVGETALLTGSAPVATLRDYPREVAAYTKGRGRLVCTVQGYAPCHNAAEVIAAAGYDPDADLQNSADSVFCAHGAGFVVRWNQVEEYMHIQGLETPDEGAEDPQKIAPRPRSTGGYTGTLAEDKELEAIFEKEFGKTKRGAFRPQSEIRARERAAAAAPQQSETLAALQVEPAAEILLVDGYNIIFAWDELKKLAADNLDTARQVLADLLCNYQGYRKCGVILVFDAYRVHGNPGSVIKYHNISVVYTREAETADSFIEKVSYKIGKNYRVRVATSDGAEQMIILGNGALRISARTFHAEVETAFGEIKKILEQHNRI